MNSQQLIKNMLKRIESERIGFSDNIWPETLALWANKQGYPLDEAGRPINPAEHFEFDMIEVGGWFDVNPKWGISDIVEENDEWIIRRNGAGACLKSWKNKTGTPEHVSFDMTSCLKWQQEYRCLLIETDRRRFVEPMEMVSRKRAENQSKGFWTFYGHMFVWETMRQSLGDLCMYENLLLDPSWITDFNRVYTDFFKSHFQILLKEGGLPDGIWLYEDMGYKNGLLCSKDILKRLVIPFFAEMVDFFKNYNLPVFLHSCGGVEEAIPLIIDAGFVGIHPMEVNAGCDVLRFARTYKDQLIFVGGFQKEILETNDKDLIKIKLGSFLNEIKEIGARYIFGSDHSISTRIKYDTFRYVVDILHQHMHY